MILWSIQNKKVYDELVNTKILFNNQTYKDEEFLFAYNWIANKMIEKGIENKSKSKYPFWAWFEKRPDMRRKGYAEKGKQIVLLKIEIKDKKVLLSDFILFHHVLNFSFLAENELEEEQFALELRKSNIESYKLRNSSHEKANYLRDKVINSWERIFGIKKEDDGYIYGKLENKVIQATFWELNISEIKEVKFFVAR